MRQVITSLFSECVAVASVSVYRLEGGSVGAVVKVNLFIGTAQSFWVIGWNSACISHYVLNLLKILKGKGFCVPV